MAEHATVIRVSRFQAAPGKRDEVKALLVGGLAEIRAAEGCFGAQLCTVREKQDELAVVSRWASNAALDHYLQHRTANVSTFRDTLAVPPETEHYDTASGT
ncbi:MAG: antibiotic biosynthesis monooxygenase [Chloroflexi bacterium]|nr:antibiotic biosynthesis monooxygenase [Chloroflexota bacterium]MBV9898773.1 antibiotic biosynthesis monooxygenase [Chloroflexota bacterium]